MPRQFFLPKYVQYVQKQYKKVKKQVQCEQNVMNVKKQKTVSELYVKVIEIRFYKP